MFAKPRHVASARGPHLRTFATYSIALGNRISVVWFAESSLPSRESTHDILKPRRVAPALRACTPDVATARLLDESSSFFFHHGDSCMASRRIDGGDARPHLSAGRDGPPLLVALLPVAASA